MDSAARLWDVDTGRELHCLEGHAAEIVSVAFNTAGGHHVHVQCSMTCHEPAAVYHEATLRIPARECSGQQVP